MITSFAMRTMIRHTYDLIGHLGREHIIAEVLSSLQEVSCQADDSANGTSSDKLHNGLSASLFFLRNGHFGPLCIKLGGSTVKRWCFLFPCLNTHKILLELVHLVDIGCFIMCFTRFINCRGKVVQLRCDRGTNFVGGERELRESLEKWKQHQIERKQLQEGCKWGFQPPTALSNSSEVYYGDPDGNRGMQFCTHC